MPANQNMNFLTTNRATLQIKGLEDFEFAVTGFTLPSLELPVSPVETMFLTGREAGDKPIYGDVEVEFIIDEDMKNWITVYEWFQGLIFQRTSTPRNSDGAIIIYSSHNNPIIKIKLYEMIPSYLSAIRFSEDIPVTTPLKAEAHFSILYYDIEKLPN